jgi:hypothetical protein
MRTAILIVQAGVNWLVETDDGRRPLKCRLLNGETDALPFREKLFGRSASVSSIARGDGGP